LAALADSMGSMSIGQPFDNEFGLLPVFYSATLV
jgi:hypothetical protein